MTSDVHRDLPGPADIVAYVTELGKPTVLDILTAAHRRGRVALQPRSGVGGHAAMIRLLRHLDTASPADVLTVTIDSHTRLGRFDAALRSLHERPGDLNGYPLVAHGWRRARELNGAVQGPLQVRHGSPDARRLFDIAVAAGMTSFEGGGISYNIPYAKDVALRDSLEAWRDVDRRCGDFAEMGLVIDRETFGTLTAVLVPPSLSLAISLLETDAAVREGVRSISISYPQGGNAIQDIAALRAIRSLATRHVPAHVHVHVVLHEYMGVFPRLQHHADQLILYGALVARLGGAQKLVTKTYQEAHGIPTAEANAAGVRLAALADSSLLAFLRLDEEAIAEEQRWIERETEAIVEPILSAPDPRSAIVQAFASGRLDVPFSASRHARSEVLPCRDATGAVRYRSWGRLPMPGDVAARNAVLVAGKGEPPSVFAALEADINHFPLLFGEFVPDTCGSTRRGESPRIGAEASSTAWSRALGADPAGSCAGTPFSPSSTDGGGPRAGT